jgi:hypothetical protein
MFLAGVWSGFDKNTKYLFLGVETLLGVLLVVTLAGDADTETEGNALDTGFPDLPKAIKEIRAFAEQAMVSLSNALSLIPMGNQSANGTIIPEKKLQSVFRPNAIC